MEPSVQELTALRREAQTRLDAVTRDVDELIERIDPHALVEAGRAEVTQTVHDASHRVSDELQDSAHLPVRVAGSAAHATTHRPRATAAVAAASAALAVVAGAVLRRRKHSSGRRR